jgi:hypothetical protein
MGEVGVMAMAQNVNMGMIMKERRRNGMYSN